MTRKMQIIHDIRSARAEAWQFHYRARAFVLTYPADVQRMVAEVLGKLPLPELNVFGVDMDGRDMPYLSPEFTTYVCIADHFGIELYLVNPFYWSEAGWLEFERRFNDLPEPIEVVPMPLWTKREVVPVVHRQADKARRLERY